ncbi:MAG: LapA family protein [Deltaproteobacteria bacterium]|nr:LapA family protein [Deltaproteobacteria bacterium]
MYLRTILMVFILGALALFTVANWHAFTRPTTLSLIVANVEAPLGLVLLGVVLLLTALFLIYVLYLQSSVLFETRRHARELHAQRELAEHAEISRIHELRSFLETQLQTLGKQTEISRSELTARLDRLETDLRQSIEQCQNALAAALAEIDDHLGHGRAPSESRKLA